MMDKNKAEKIIAVAIKGNPKNKRINLDEKDFEDFKLKANNVLNEAEPLSRAILQLTNTHQYNAVCVAFALAIQVACDLGGHTTSKVLKDIDMCITWIKEAEANQK